MTNLFLKRIVIFIAVMLLSYFVPWQVTALLLLGVAIFIEGPIEYIFIVVGVFGGGIFSIFWGLLCFVGLFVRGKTRLSPNFL